MSVLGAEYGERVALRLGVPPAGEDATRAHLAELTGGAAATRVVGERWVDTFGA